MLINEEKNMQKPYWFILDAPSVNYWRKKTIAHIGPLSVHPKKHSNTTAGRPALTVSPMLVAFFAVPLAQVPFSAGPFMCIEKCDPSACPTHPSSHFFFTNTCVLIYNTCSLCDLFILLNVYYCSINKKIKYEPSSAMLIALSLFTLSSSRTNWMDWAT